MNKLIDYLNTKGIQSLAEEFHVIVKECQTESGALYVLNYDQIKSPKNEITNSCRGTIVWQETPANEFIILCCPFDRFYNCGETQCTIGEHDIPNIHWATKLDGSLMKVWFNFINGQWEVGTRGTAFADSPVGAYDLTFRELFLSATGFSSLNDFMFHSDTDIHTTYIFELTAFENRVVTKYTEPRIWFLGSRDNIDYSYKRYNPFHNNQEIKVPEWLSFPSLEEATAYVASLPDLQEGLVGYSVDYMPVCKLKSPQYVRAHRVRGNGLTPKRIHELVLMNEHEEYLAIFPEDTKYFTPSIDVLNRLCDDLPLLWNQYKDVESQKEFALQIKDSVYSSILFKTRQSGLQPIVVFHSLRPSVKLGIIESLIKKG